MPLILTMNDLKQKELRVKLLKERLRAAVRSMEYTRAAEIDPAVCPRCLGVYASRERYCSCDETLENKHI
jgi:hypothetical protein